MLEVEQLDDKPVFGLELTQQFMHQLAGGKRGIRRDVVLVGEDAIEHPGLVLRKIGPAKFRAAFLSAQLVNAGRHRDA